MKRLAIALTAGLTLAAVASADTQKKDVDIKASDGVTLKGTYFSPGRPGPAMLLLHQCNMDRHASSRHQGADAPLRYGERGGEGLPRGHSGRCSLWRRQRRRCECREGHQRGGRRVEESAIQAQDLHGLRAWSPDVPEEPRT